MPVPRVQDGLPNSDFYLLAGPDDGLEDLSLLRPLDPELVAAELAELGFVDGHGRPPAARQLPRIDLELVRDGHPRLALSTATYKRTLRLLDVEALDDLTTPQGREIVQRFADLARRLNARLLTGAENLADDA